MEDLKGYKWKNLSDKGKYVEAVSTSLITIQLKSSDFLFISSYFKELLNGYDIVEVFLNKYNKISIPNQSIDFINTLLSFNGVERYNNHFYVIACVFQEIYITSIENDSVTNQPLVLSFQDESKDLRLLLDIIRDWIEGDRLKTNSISFKGKKTRTINNFFIVNDMFNMLIEKYGLTLTNFDTIKEKLISNTNNIKFEEQDEYWKYLFCRSLLEFKTGNNNVHKISNSDIKFVGQFLSIIQTPINKSPFELFPAIELSNLITLDDIKYLRTFIKRHKSFFV
jgi:hypothetical protein